jgi:hypothetical protein
MRARFFPSISGEPAPPPIIRRAMKLQSAIITTMGSTHPMRNERQTSCSMRPPKTTPFCVSVSRSALSSMAGSRVASKLRSGGRPAQPAASDCCRFSASSRSAGSWTSSFTWKRMRSAPISASSIAPCSSIWRKRL